ncbi:MAG: hypothetical protein ABI622_03710 [Chloroflexota bacterium]
MTRVERADELSRQPAWSGTWTAPLEALIPMRGRGSALTVIKGIHTAIFFSVAGSAALFAWDGLRGRPRRRTAVAGAVVLGESAIYVSNNQVCPLTPLAEALGATSGSVADIFLPTWLSRRIPLFGTTLFLIGIVLNVNAWMRRHAHRSAGAAVHDGPPFVSGPSALAEGPSSRDA